MSVSDAGAPAPREAIEAAKQMTEALADFAGELKKLSARDRRSRLYLRILGVSFAIDIALTVAMGWVTIQTDHNSHAIHQSQLSACQSANEQRDNERAIWTYVLDGIAKPVPGESAQQIAKTNAAVAVFQHKVNVTFADHNCAAVYRLP